MGRCKLVLLAIPHTCWEFLEVREWVQVLLQKDRYLEMSQSVKNQVNREMTIDYQFENALNSRNKMIHWQIFHFCL